MPAFTFEKISPPPRSAPPARPSHALLTPQGAAPQPRDNVIQVLGRFVIARVREDGPVPEQPSSK